MSRYQLLDALQGNTLDQDWLLSVLKYIEIGRLNDSIQKPVNQIY